MSLDLKIQAYQKNIPLSFYDLEKQLVGLRAEIDWIADVPANSLILIIQRLGQAYKAFYNSGRGYPKFQSKKKSSCIPFRGKKSINDIRQISETSFILPKIGVVRVFKDRPICGQITNATITKEIDKYYLHIYCETELKPLKTCDNQVGIDVGLANFAVCSNGDFIDHPKFHEGSLQKLRIAQRKLSRAKKRGKNWYKQVAVIQKIYQKTRRQRSDFLHKVSCDLIQTNGFISVEKLNIKGLVRSNLSTQIYDSGWYDFRRMLKYKSELYGRTYFEVDPRYSSQECNSCGHRAAENRPSQSIFRCVNCGHSDHADLNASKNLLRRGHRLLAQSTDSSQRLAKELVA
jgi:putative transposase